MSPSVLKSCRQQFLGAAARWALQWHRGQRGEGDRAGGSDSRHIV